MSAQVVVLAGGRATRLGHLAEQVPKVLQPVAGRPFLDILLAALAVRGANRVHLCLGHLGDRVEAHLRRLPSDLVPSVTTSSDEPPAGTAGALRGAGDHLDDVFAVAMGDTLLDLGADWPDLIARLPPRALGMMVVTSAPSQPRPNVSVRDGLVTAYDKRGIPGGLTDTGVAVLRREALRRVPGHGGTADLGELFGSLAADASLAAVTLDASFHDIGTPEQIRELDHWLLRPAPDRIQEGTAC